MIPSAIEVCRSDLFTSEADLQSRYPQILVDKVLRVREMYNWFISNPNATDREFVAEVCQRHDISRGTAYSGLAIVKTLLPALSSASRDFHRWHTNEMLIATYNMAKARKNSKTMERAATAYGKLNRVDLEDEQAIPLDPIHVQPFTATDDPRVLGIEPIPNIQVKISQMLDKYRAETLDIEDVEFEEVDLELPSLFAEPNEENQADEEEIL